MLEKITMKAKEEFSSFKMEISMTFDGYKFGKYLAKDIKERLELIAYGVDNPLNELVLLLQVYQYKEAFSDIQKDVGDPYSNGIAIYGLTHKKDDNMINELYDHISSIK